MTDAEDAAERLGRVVQLVAPPAVELREGREVPQERYLGGERRAARRHRRALERIRVGEGDLGEGVDQPVAVQVIVRVRRAPVTAGRVADLMALRRAPQAEDD